MKIKINNMSENILSAEETAIEFLKSNTGKYGLNRLPFVLYEGVSKLLVDYATQFNQPLPAVNWVRAEAMALAIEQTFRQYEIEDKYRKDGEYNVSFLYPANNIAYQMLYKSLKEFRETPLPEKGSEPACYLVPIQLIDGFIKKYDAENIAPYTKGRVDACKQIAKCKKIKNFQQPQETPVVLSDEEIEAIVEKYAAMAIIGGKRVDYSIREAIKAALQTSAGWSDEDWISIKTLPEKAKPIMLCNGHWIGVGYYDKNWENQDEEEPKWSDETNEYIYPEPTHWRELPPYPKQYKQSK